MLLELLCASSNLSKILGRRSISPDVLTSPEDCPDGVQLLESPWREQIHVSDRQYRSWEKNKKWFCFAVKIIQIHKKNQVERESSIEKERTWKIR